MSIRRRIFKTLGCHWFCCFTKSGYTANGLIEADKNSAQMPLHVKQLSSLRNCFLFLKGGAHRQVKFCLWQYLSYFSHKCTFQQSFDRFQNLVKLWILGHLSFCLTRWCDDPCAAVTITSLTFLLLLMISLYLLNSCSEKKCKAHCTGHLPSKAPGTLAEPLNLVIQLTGMPWMKSNTYLSHI